MFYPQSIGMKLKLFQAQISTQAYERILLLWIQQRDVGGKIKRVTNSSSHAAATGEQLGKGKSVTFSGQL